METNEVDNQFLRDYDIMRRQMEDRQINEYYKAQRQIYSTMMGDTPVKQYTTDSTLITYPLMIVRYKEFQSQCTIN